MAEITVSFLLWRQGDFCLLIAVYYWYVVHICVSEPKNHSPCPSSAGPHGRYARYVDGYVNNDDLIKDLVVQSYR